MIFYTIGTFKPNKKTVNAVLYELARLALFFKNSENLTSCGFHILNQLMEGKAKEDPSRIEMYIKVETNPNLQFASLNLLKDFENYSENALKMLKIHC